MGTATSIAPMLVWMDLEMTGLDPLRDVIVEIATVVTDDDLTVVAEGPDLVVNAPEERLAKMEQVVKDMHARSGLLEAIRSSTLTLADAGARTLDFIKSHVPEPGTVPLCGNSIGTDRRFLAAQLPAIESWLHYRCIDVSTVKELCRRWYPVEFKGAPSKRTAHRALGDIRESIAELAYYRSAIFVQPGADCRHTSKAGERPVTGSDDPPATTSPSHRSAGSDSAGSPEHPRSIKEADRDGGNVNG